MNNRPSLKQQLSDLRKAARERGLGIRKDPRLNDTPYRAMHPLAARELRQPCIPNCITHDTRRRYPLRVVVMDIRHEVIEFDKMKRDRIKGGSRYMRGHRLANRKQRTIGAEKRSR